jgi:DNA-binding transcriptional ArsR family regulator
MEAPLAQIPNLREIMEAERLRLQARKQELEHELDEINSHLEGIGAYFDHIDRRQPAITPPTPSAERRERGAVQEQVKATIYSRPEGISTSEINKALDGISPQSIQNSLTALRKAGQITKDDARGGKHRPVTIEPTPPAEADAPT